MVAQRLPTVIVVTGASAGVGRAVVRRFTRRKVKLGLIARGETGLEEAADEVRAAGSRAGRTELRGGGLDPG
ncbi:SDR family NAD(P)-dependent oxidoreductase [Micromonospora sp. CPCC 206061]|uniref:SDR family NAD(P)-dependent oxidoreductase n=1 Tax=Micromonospora sp. CPCC 206061 TaxID=3122410 RepID=UPI002FF0B642